MTNENKTILVTGGAGFIGSHLVDRLVEEGHEVVVVDNLATGKEENINSEAEFYKLNLASDELAKVFEKETPEVVFHLGAQINARRAIKEPLFDAHTNIIGSLNLLEEFRRISANNNNAELVFASSGGCVYGEPEEFPTPETHPTEPDTPYGVAKLAFEKYLGCYPVIDWISLRLGNVYGPRQDSQGEAGVIAIFIENLLSGETCRIFGDGKQTRDYVYVDDVIKALLRAYRTDTSNWGRQKRTINIGTEKETSVNQIYKKVKNTVNDKNMPVDIEPVHEEAKEGDIRRSCLSIKKAAELLDWQPEVSLDEGIGKTVEWFRKRR